MGRWADGQSVSEAPDASTLIASFIVLSPEAVLEDKGEEEEDA